MSCIEKISCFSTLTDQNDLVGIHYMTTIHDGKIIITNKNRTIKVQNVSYVIFML